MIRDRRVIGLLLLLALPGAARAGETWVRRLDGGPASRDVARLVRVAASGNVYVAGTFGAAEGAGDIGLVKYAPDGTLAWQKRYDGSGSGLDEAIGLAVDGAGNAFVAGTSEGTDGTRDIVTLKYTSAGALAWERRFTGLAADDDEAAGIGLVSVGTIVVAGTSRDSSGRRNVVLIGYNPTTGAQQWMQREAGVPDSDEVALAMDIGTSGRIFVAGFREDSAGYSRGLVAAYSNLGDPLWVRVGPGSGASINWLTAVRANLEDGCVAAGFSGENGTSGDIVTLWYQGDGALAWQVRHDGPAGHWDGAACLAIDAAEDVYVGGAQGAPDSTTDGIALKYSADGTPLWTRFLVGIDRGHDEYSAVTVDAQGNAYFAGTSASTAGSLDYVAAKFDPAGRLLSRWRYDGPSHYEDGAVAIAVGPDRSVYVTGGSAGTDSVPDFVTIKYDSAAVLTDAPAGTFVPSQFRLGRPAPNPAGASTTVAFDLPVATAVTLTLFDTQGRVARRALEAARYPAGRHRLALRLEGLPVGVYFLVLEAHPGLARGESHRLVIVR